MTSLNSATIAAIVKNLQPDAPKKTNDRGMDLAASIANAERAETIKELTTLLCAAMKTENPKFDKSDFLAKCGA